MKIIRNLTVILIVLLMLMSSVFAASADKSDMYLTDDAETLSADENVYIAKELAKLSAKYSVNIAIFTEKNSYAVDAYTKASEKYLSTDFEYGSGILLYYSFGSTDTDDNRYYILTRGDAIRHFNNAALTEIEESVNPLVANGKSFSAYKKFIEICDGVLALAEEGKTYKSDFDFLKVAVITLVCGFAVAIITVSVMKSKLKSVKAKSGAAEYTRKDSMNVSVSQDIYLYSTVRRTPRPKNNGSSGGSRSRGGGSFGGRGGRF